MWAAGAIAVIFAGLMLFQRSLYACALCLLFVLMQTSLLFLLAGAPLLAFLQIMIYAGAVMVLVVVTIMAAPGPAAGGGWSRLAIPRPLAVAGLLLPIAELAVVSARGGLGQAGALGSAMAAQTRIGPILFGPYAVATEAVGILMLLSGLAVLGRRGRP